MTDETTTQETKRTYTVTDKVIEQRRQAGKASAESQNMSDIASRGGKATARKWRRGPGRKLYPIEPEPETTPDE